MIHIVWIFLMLIGLVFLGFPIFIAFIITSFAAVVALDIPLSVINRPSRHSRRWRRTVWSSRY